MGQPRVFTHGVIGAAAFRPRCMPPSLALWLIPRRTIVDQYVALDVSLQKTAVCVLNVSGRVLIEADVPSEPAALIAFIQTHAPRAARVGCWGGRPPTASIVPGRGRCRSQTKGTVRGTD